MTHTKSFIFLTLVTAMSAASCWGAEPIQLASRLELLVDDFLFDRLSGAATLQVHQPQPKEVALVTDKPWEGNTCAYYTLFQDGEIYRMYYRGSHADTKTQRSLHPEVTCYAESKDGIHWTKPELGLFSWQGSKANNIVLKGLGTHCFTPFRDDNPNCPPEARYKAISRGRPVGKRGLYVYQSADAVNWKLIKDEPVITDGAFDSQNLAFWDPVTKNYVDYHRTFVAGVRSIMNSTSPDFVNWSKPVLLNYPNAAKQHLYTNAIRPYFRAPHIRIGFPTRYTPQSNQVEPIFMSSRDGTTFHRFNDAVIPRTAPKDRGGNRSNYMANGLLQLPGNDRELSVYGTEAYYQGPDSRLRRFVYRLDGFSSVGSSADGGELLSKPFVFAGDSLHINFATRGKGSLQLELQKADGTAIQGFELSQCQPIHGDEIRHSVKWKSAPDLAKLNGTPVRLRIKLLDANLYSLKFASEG